MINFWIIEIHLLIRGNLILLSQYTCLDIITESFIIGYDKQRPLN